jgi:phosphoribosylanthranilate isomerase
MASPKVKLCGFSEEETINFAATFNIDFMGFVFYEHSPRNVDINNIAKITKNIPDSIKKVAVIVDADNSQIEQIIAQLKPDFLQLHGNETPSRAQEIKKLFNIEIIKAFGISSADDLTQIKDFEEIAQYYLFDAKVKGQKGGTSQTFDWTILKHLNTKKEWFLSGGINANNLQNALKETEAKIIDLSSAIEESGGVKSKKLIQAFMYRIVLA